MLKTRFGPDLVNQQEIENDDVQRSSLTLDKRTIRLLSHLAEYERRNMKGEVQYLIDVRIKELKHKGELVEKIEIA